MKAKLLSLLKPVIIKINDKSYRFTDKGVIEDIDRPDLKLLCDELVKREYPDRDVLTRHKIANIHLSLANAVKIIDIPNTRQVDITGIASGAFDINYHYDGEKEEKLLRAAQKGGIAECDAYLDAFKCKMKVYDRNGKVDIKKSEVERSSGRFTQQVLQLKARLLKRDKEFKEIANGDTTLVKCEKFMSEFPTHPGMPEIRIKLAHLREVDKYDKAVNGSIEECEEYMRAYPTGIHIQEVREKYNELNRIEFYDTAINGGIEECEAFLNVYKEKDEYTKEVQEKYDELKAASELETETTIFKTAMTGTEEECQKYLTLYPEGHYISEISSKLSDIREAEELIVALESDDENAFYIAKNGSIEDKEEFLTKYPDSEHCDEIKQNIKDLQIAEKAIEELEKENNETKEE